MERLLVREMDRGGWKKELEGAVLGWGEGEDQKERGRFARSLDWG
jgi:hypothetical protein